MPGYTEWFEGGPDNTKPFNNAEIYFDYVAKVRHEYATGSDVVVPMTTEEIAWAESELAQINEVMKTLTLQQKLDNAIIGNATYLGLTSPTTAQNTAQIRALTRIVNGLLKLRSGNLKDTNGT